MHVSLLHELNAARSERRTCMVVTDLGAGKSELIFPGLDHGWPEIAQDITDHFASGASGEVVAGERRFFLRPHIPPLRIIVVGAVHIAQALGSIAATLGYEMVIIDPRTLFASQDRFPAARLITDWPKVALPTLGVDRATACVMLTHDPKLDDDALRYVLPLDCFYVGALGSRKTHAKRIARLLGEGIAQEQIDRIHAPIGLAIGALTPEEIALSIVAEIVAAWRAERIAAKERK